MSSSLIIYLDHKVFWRWNFFFCISGRYHRKATCCIDGTTSRPRSPGLKPQQSVEDGIIRVFYHTPIIKCTKPPREPFHLCPLLISSTVLTPFKWPLPSVPRDSHFTRAQTAEMSKEFVSALTHPLPWLPSASQHTPVRAELPVSPQHSKHPY